MSQELREEARRREQERRRLSQREQEFAGDMRLIAARPEGKRLLRRLLEDGDIFNPGWTPGATGAYQAGRRAQALGLWRHLREHLPGSVCLDLLLPGAGEADPKPAQEEASGEDWAADDV